MEKSFRLSSDGMFSRPEEIFPETPLRIIFLSVEGNVTEQNYFGWLEKYREKLGIKTGVHVHPLRRGKRDNFSAPAQVLELLEEYIEIRESDILPDRMRKVIPTKYTDTFVQQYMKDPDSVDKDKKEQFEMLLKQVGIDLEYQFFVKEYQGQDDLFGVVIDRDYNTHTVMQLNEIRKQCIEKGYHFFITTPCFEFWLLLHLVDVKKQYKGDMQKFRDNEKRTNKHTFTSLQVSEYAGHSKKISEKIFRQYYLNHIDYAISQVKKFFSTDVEKLIGTDETEDSKKGKLGSNLPELFKLLREL
mgnify:FL=1